MQPVPVQKSRIRNVLEGGNGIREGLARRRWPRCVEYASGSGLRSVLGRYLSYHGVGGFRTYLGIRTPGLHCSSRLPNG